MTKHIGKRVKKKDLDLQVADNNTNVDQYDTDIVTKYKKISLSIADTITLGDIKKASLSQRVMALGILQDKINLKEGKSTENIAHRVLHELSPESIKQIQELGRSLIKRMLSDGDS